MSPRLRDIALAASLLAAPSAVAAQTLDRRVSGAGDGPVQFHFSSRDGVCGNGHSFMRSDENGYYSSYNTSDGNDNMCAHGPVRVVVVRAGKEIIKIETYAGPLVADANSGQDLGAVPAREAASYLLGLAATLDGRPARDAVLPAMLGDSVVVTPQLLQLAKDQGRSRDLRSSAISWLARRRSEAGGVGAQVVGRTLDQLVRDRNENESVRQSALSTISSLDRGEGVPILIGFASDPDTWLSKQSFATLSTSGDPRARTFIRQQVRRTDLAEESRLSAIRGLGNGYATGEDYRMLRDLYPTLSTDAQRDQVINTLGSAGGSENSNWLLALARSPTETLQRRRRVISLLGRSDDPRVKDALKELAGN